MHTWISWRGKEISDGPRNTGSQLTSYRATASLAMLPTYGERLLASVPRSLSAATAAEGSLGCCRTDEFRDMTVLLKKHKLVVGLHPRMGRMVKEKCRSTSAHEPFYMPRQHLLRIFS